MNQLAAVLFIARKDVQYLELVPYKPLFWFCNKYSDLLLVIYLLIPRNPSRQASFRLPARHLRISGYTYPYNPFPAQFFD